MASLKSLACCCCQLEGSSSVDSSGTGKSIRGSRALTLPVGLEESRGTSTSGHAGQVTTATPLRRTPLATDDSITFVSLPEPESYHVTWIACLARELGMSSNCCVGRPKQLDHDGIFDNAVHLKGFASGFDFHDKATDSQLQCTLKEIERLQPATIVWDGDDYCEQSFTYLIPKIYRQMFPPPRLVMFISGTLENERRVQKSWQQTGLPITCFSFASQIGWEDLGVEALRVTQSKQVVCFGGGGVLSNEYERASKDVRFFVVDVARNRGGVQQRSPLMQEKVMQPIGDDDSKLKDTSNLLSIYRLVPTRSSTAA
eukprot:TRINITY_DN36100_c0_g1_i1.p1 TRINITY_DN36100_c0_g1~~TRINITY_DN36100_c0_g1_i1.p1  ORF type:complete len:314 (+),score=42.84 TRINITY_DN36100_c0_g1_i1:91-1032(+)